MADTVTGLLLKDHDKVRAHFDEWEHAVQTFNIPRLKFLLAKFETILTAHVLKEEAVLYLILFKHLKFTDKKIPGLYLEHHEVGKVARMLEQKLTSPRFTGNETDIERLGTEYAFKLKHHMADEEKNVWPYAEQLLTPEEKNYVVKQYRMIDSDMSALSRQPLVSLYPNQDDSTQTSTPGLPGDFTPHSTNWQGNSLP